MSDIRANTISDTSGNGPINLHKQSAAKAYATPAATGALTWDSLNVASAVDEGTGEIGVNFANSMSTATYSVTMTVVSNNAVFSSLSSPSASGFDCKVFNSSGTLVNSANSTQVLGELA